ncbi:MAG: hypothetical protein E7647_08090 [Ruminococcaceae bacterium]|nr:hypothetical protein [Oscillospiraceae bacterium]
MNKCPYCGSEVQESAQFCLYCMKSLKEKTDITPKEERRASPFSVIILSVTVLALLVVAAILLPRWLASSGKDGGTDGKVPPISTVDTKEPAEIQQDTESTGGTGTATDPCKDGHTWRAVTESVHHEEAGHYETVQTGTVTVSLYKCAVCYGCFESYEEYYSHFQSEHIAKEDELVVIFLDRYDLLEEKRPVYEKTWVVDMPAYDEEIVTGYICSVCGSEKEP